MNTIQVPHFVKSMGHKIIAYLLNVSDEDAIQVLEGKQGLDDKRCEVLQKFIEICRQLRSQGIDNGDVDFHVLHSLPQMFIEDKHLFSALHESMGGEIKYIEHTDKIVHIVNRFATKLFPLFLIKFSSRPTYFQKMHDHIRTSVYHLPEYKELCTEIMKDPVLSKIFDNVGTNAIQTYGSYSASTGQGGGIQLATLPQTLFINSYELMRMRGYLDLEEFSRAAEFTVNVLRDAVQGNTVQVPVFIGLRNTSIDKLGEIEVAQGVIRPINDGLADLVPIGAGKTSIGGETYNSGFVLETTYPYKVNFGEPLEIRKGGTRWPKELEYGRENISFIVENLSLSLALACDRTPPVGLGYSWTMIFDPLSHGVQPSYSSETRSPMPLCVVEPEERKSLIDWCSLIENTDDAKIRLAIRRVLSSINQRMDPLDGFVDSIIAWENLFGGNAELSFRISISIAKLLADAGEERKKLQKIVKDHYNTRSKVVHGVKELTPEEAVKYRDECLDIALKSLRLLYANHPDMIQDPNRSTRLALT
ncbi:Apea-like HEPN domain-containing protein [Vibrio crassostreae]|nr:Apea-like HEPN domain-containing protein [Vibrio crassostreae]CAK3454970.1 Apea-like HEPN domain-containing protein [Vibrio crassostreae]CAK3459661.1 Apea-like HEPN domain-containing protein [Vibrio crassostreae]CAK3489858.1 Apea-like HEPN domain-containing protein [Vibrio crassostreae]CAK3560434.1 Apea-like HEPN domain-containing protein [Vibrio crassostreae]